MSNPVWSESNPVFNSINNTAPIDVKLIGKTFHVKKHHGGEGNLLKLNFLAGMGYAWAVEGECASSCTLAAELMGCVSDGARLGYHSGYNIKTHEWIDITGSYRPELVAYINKKGGFPKAHDRVTWLEGEELDMFFDRCPS